MKKKGLISIFVLIISILACGFIFANNKNITNAYAAEAEIIYFNLIGQDGNFYTSENAVAKVVGGGDFVVGETNKDITATVVDNYQIKGWRITYKEQGNRTEDIDTSDLISNSKIVELTNKSGEIVNASVTYTLKDNIYQTSTFKLLTVFEDLKIEPIIDTVYYKVDATTLISVSKPLNSLSIGDDTLYYDSATVDGEVTRYTGSYIQIGEKYYYYGEVNEKAGKYYTLHNTLSSTPIQEEIEYKVGSHRIQDNVQISLDINIISDNLYESSNIDVVGVGLIGTTTSALTLNSTNAEVPNSYRITKDNLRRTTACDINFAIAASKTQVNEVKVQYHTLYVVDVVLTVDGEDSHSEHEDIFGAIVVDNNSLSSNISIHNFYTRVKEDNSQFLVKAANDNNAKSFGVTCSRTITQVVDYVNYEYYIFSELDGLSSTSKYYSSFASNIEIKIDYRATKHEIKFVCVEYIKNNQDVVTLVELDGQVLETIYKKRGEQVELTLDSAKNIDNIGYRLVGYTNSLTGSVTETFVYLLDESKPAGTTIYMCFEKIEYAVVFSNYNQISIDGEYPISSINFSISNPDGYLSETFNSADLAGENVQLESKIKIGGVLVISDIVNKGFEVLGYGLVQPVYASEHDCLVDKTLILDENFIKTYCSSYAVYAYDESLWSEDWDRLYISNGSEYVLNASSEYDSNVTYYEKTNSTTFTLYVYEEYIRYELTYIIDKTRDTALAEDVTMAEINAICDGADVAKYDANGLLIYAANSNESALVGKIVVSNLKYKDQVKLTSKPLSATVGEDVYTYAFNWYTEDGKSTLPYSFIDNEYVLNETIQRTRTIKVVYTMPSTKLYITLSEEFVRLQEEGKFDFAYQVERAGQPLEMDKDQDGNTILNQFSVDVGVTLDVTIANIVFGYAFIGYTNIEDDVSVIAGTTFTYETVNGFNTLRLDFNRIEYQFVFSQYGAERVGLADGTKLKFKVNGEDKDYAVLNVDNTTLTIVKPEGYYVSDVVFAGNFRGYSEELSENNNMRNNADIINYEFNLSRDAFIVLASDYSSENVVQVRLDYRLFTYRVQINYSLLNAKGDSRDNYVAFPNMKLTYVFDGNPMEATKDPTAPKNTVVFQNIHYGADVTIELLTGAPMGFSFGGWYYVNNFPIVDGTASAKGLVVREVKQDKTDENSFVYTLKYNTYTINMNYDSSQGSPVVMINNVIQNETNKYITMYDNLQIEANPSRNVGYGFDNITYQKPVYTPYVYNSETWEIYKDALYVLIDGIYQKNTSTLYDSNRKYFVYSEETVVIHEQILTINEILIGNFVLDENKQAIVFVINYKLIDLSISNTFTEYVSTGYWSLLGAGKGDARVEFDINDFASISILAIDKEDEVREILPGNYINYNDSITVRVSINKEAVNIDSVVYDLTKGLKLRAVNVNGEPIGFSVVPGETGVYEFSFYVGKVFPAYGEEINILYNFELEGKEVEVTTIVKESAMFYNNVSLHIDAATKYDFEPSIYYTTGEASISQYLQFLAKATVDATFNTEDYKRNFEISGVVIYCDGVEVPSSKYDEFGINVNAENMTVDIRVLGDIEAVFIVQPIITFNGGPAFAKTFACNESGVGQSQKLSIGSTADADIQMAEMLVDAVTIKYKASGTNTLMVDSVTDVGLYDAYISFVNTIELDWLNEIRLAENVTLEIKTKNIYVTYDEAAIVKESKIYNGSSNYNVANIYQYLIFTDNNAFNVSYKDIMEAYGNNLALKSASCYITTAGKDGEVALANETVYYNLYVYDLSLKENQFNNNFKFQNTDLVINEFIQITRKPLTLCNLVVQSKVYDGTDKAVLGETDKIQISGVITGDEVIIDVARLNPKFEDVNVGTNKKVILDASTALSGLQVSNYYINTIETQGVSIYPYNLKAEIVGVGTIEVINKRGLTDVEKVDLIPINATLDVVPIYFESPQFVAIYNKINKYLKGNNEFAIGYSVSFIVNGENIPLNRELYLSVPQIENMTGSYYLTGVQTGHINVAYEAGNLVIDLSQMGEDFDKLILVKAKFLLKVWQIVLIVIGSVLIVAGGIMTFFIIRKRKINRDSVHEKI